MLEETNARHSGTWKPQTTFASEMGLTEKGVSIVATEEDIHGRMRSVS